MNKNINQNIINKEHYNISFMGHVDHGKSTLVGEILIASQYIKPQKLAELKTIAEGNNKQSFYKAYLLDKTEDERKKGVTIELSHNEFVLGDNHFTIIDCPGHADYIKNAITGLSQSDVVVVVLSCTAGIEEQTKEHITLARTYDISNLIIAINKIDEVNYKEESYNTRKEEITEFLRKRGYKEGTVPILPTSGYLGDNVATKSSNLPWYNGPTLFEVIEKIKLNKKVNEEIPFRLLVESTMSIPGSGLIITGNCLSGTATKGSDLIVKPTGKEGKLASIEAHNQKLDFIKKGFNCGLQIKGLTKGDLKRGDVIGLKSNPPLNVREFDAECYFISIKEKVKAGRNLILFIGSTLISCKVGKVVSILDPRTGVVKEENPEGIGKGQKGVVRLVPIRPIVIEPLSVNPYRSRFAIREGRETIGGGYCTKVEYTAEDSFNLK